MPRVLRIINRLNLGGPTYNAACLSKGLAPEYETLLLAGMRDKGEASSRYILERAGVEPQLLPQMQRAIHPLRDCKALRDIKQVMREFRPDIVHTHASKAGALGRLAAIQLNVPVIVHTFHGHVFYSYFGSLRSRFFLAIERYLARKSSAIIALSPAQKQELVKKYRVCASQQCRIVPLGFELEKFQNNTSGRESFRKKYGLKSGEVAIGIIGRLVPVKNHLLFLEMFEKLLRTYKVPVRGFIVGDGMEKARILDEAQARQIPVGTPDHPKPDAPLLFTSWQREIEAVIAGLDIVVCTSHNEGTPVSLIEAQAAGKPVVGTNVGGVPDTLVDGKTGLLTAPGDADNMAKAVRKLADDKALREEMGAAGHHFAREHFTCRQLVERMDGLYRDLLVR